MNGRTSVSIGRKFAAAAAARRYDVLGDLDEDGMWKVQGYVVLSSGTYHTDIHRFKVHRNL